MDNLVIEWNNQKTLFFIDLYKCRPVLWDSKHPEYYNRHVKNDAWQDISDAVELPSEECKRKITTLLASLRREKRKIRMGNGTGKDGNESSWFFYNSMSFLRDREQFRRPTKADNNSKNEKNADQAAATSPNIEVDIEDLDDEILTTNQDFANLWEVQEVDNSCESEAIDSIQTPTPQKKKRRYSNDLPTEESNNKPTDFPHLSAALQELRRIADSVKEEKNEFNIFGSFVAANLNKLPLIRALKLQEKINSLITTERINYASSSKS